jgi:hypothetical protein
VEALRLVVLLAIAGCGRIDFDARALDATTTSGSDAGACLGTGAFSNIQAVSAINTPITQYGTFISPDGLMLLWDQAGTAHQELYMTQRATRTDAFPAGGPIPGMFPNGNASDATITADLLELYFSSDVTGKLCIYHATRTDPAAAFDQAIRQTALCNGIDTTGPAISADGLTLAYNSSADANAEGDLYVTERTDRTMDFPAGKKLNGLPPMIGYPALSADRLRLWFEQEISGGFKIVAAVRISPSDDFSQLHDMTEIDTSGGEGDASLTLDESIMGFASTRPGNWDAYTATRPCL